MNSLPAAEWWRPGPVAELAPGMGVLAARQPQGSGGGLAFGALLTFTFIQVLAPQSFLPALRPFRIALVTALVGITAHVVERLARRRPITVWSREMALTAALVAWAVVTLPLSYWPGGSASFLLDTYFKTVAIFWLLANAVDSLPRLRTLAWGLTAMTVPLALTAVRNFVSGDFIATGHSVKRILGYEAGLTANPNDLALMLNLLLPFGVALLLSTPGALARGLLLGVVLLQAAGVVVTFSRGGFLALATIVALYLWRLARRGAMGWALAGLLACLAGASLLPGEYRARLSTITDIEGDPTGSAQARWSDTVAALRFVAANPVIGAGAGMNTLALNEVRGAAWKEVHNAYLQYAVELGIIGLGLFLALLLACLGRVRSVRRRTAGDPARRQLFHLAEGTEIALVAFAVAALFGPVGYQFYFYYLAGLAVASAGVYRTVERDRESRASEGVA